MILYFFAMMPLTLTWTIFSFYFSSMLVCGLVILKNSKSFIYLDSFLSSLYNWFLAHLHDLVKYLHFSFIFLFSLFGIGFWVLRIVLLFAIILQEGTSLRFGNFILVLLMLNQHFPPTSKVLPWIVFMSLHS